MGNCSGYQLTNKEVVKIETKHNELCRASLCVRINRSTSPDNGLYISSGYNPEVHGYYRRERLMGRIYSPNYTDVLPILPNVNNRENRRNVILTQT